MDLVPTLLDWAAIPTEQRLPMDGVSLNALIDGASQPDRIVFSEYHVEKVRAPCFMVRKGRYKYIYIHGHGSQLFDLEADPGEWDNLAGQLDMQAVENELHGLIVARFDADQIAEAGAASVRKRILIRQALKLNNTHWDYVPYFDATKQYVR
jgi:choline-sulfatase